MTSNTARELIARLITAKASKSTGILTAVADPLDVAGAILAALCAIAEQESET